MLGSPLRLRGQMEDSQCRVLGRQPVLSIPHLAGTHLLEAFPPVQGRDQFAHPGFGPRSRLRVCESVACARDRYRAMDEPGFCPVTVEMLVKRQFGHSPFEILISRSPRRLALRESASTKAAL